MWCHCATCPLKHVRAITWFKLVAAPAPLANANHAGTPPRLSVAAPVRRAPYRSGFFLALRIASRSAGRGHAGCKANKRTPRPGIELGPSDLQSDVSPAALSRPMICWYLQTDLVFFHCGTVFFHSESSTVKKNFPRVKKNGKRDFFHSGEALQSEKKQCFFTLGASFL